MEWLRRTCRYLLNKNYLLYSKALFYTKLYEYWQYFLSQLCCCDLCDTSVFQSNNQASTLLLCSSCLQDLPLFDQNIVQGDLLNWPKICQALPQIHFDHLFCLAPYISPFTEWLPQFKYQGRFELASLFTELICQQWQKNQPKDENSLVLSVPLHINKWQVRGYNQAHLIAKKFAQTFHYNYCSTAIKRVRTNNSQVGESGISRRKNLKNTFEINSFHPLPDNIILIDDVVTTGSTASEISRLLKLAGAKKVTVIAVCLALPN